VVLPGEIIPGIDDAVPQAFDLCGGLLDCLLDHRHGRAPVLDAG
jgi:hypothetical protein